MISLQEVRNSRRASIEEQARRILHRHLLREEAARGRKIDPKELLPIDPVAIATGVLGFEVASVWGDQTNWPKEGKFVGSADWRGRRIEIDRELPPDILRLTIGHEIYHLLKQPTLIQFREDPRTDAALVDRRKPALEQDADAFAGWLFAPRKLLTYYYESLFGAPIDGSKITEDQAFCIFGEHATASEVRRMEPLVRASLVAKRTSFVTKQPRSLTEIFGLSATPVGIQLLRTGLFC